MKKYISPVIEVCEFKGEDIITASTILSEALQNWANDTDNQPAIAAELDYSNFTAFE